MTVFFISNTLLPILLRISIITGALLGALSLWVIIMNLKSVPEEPYLNPKSKTIQMRIKNFRLLLK